MKKESDTVIPENIEDIRKQLNETGYCMAGMPATPENALVQKSDHYQKISMKLQ